AWNSTLARNEQRERYWKNSRQAEARRYQPADPGTNDRRTLFEVIYSSSIREDEGETNFSKFTRLKNDLERFSKTEKTERCRRSGAHRSLRSILRVAVWAGFRNHDRKRSAPRFAVVHRRRRYHSGQDRRRAA